MDTIIDSTFAPEENENIKKREEAEFQRELKICLDWLKDKPRTKSINRKIRTVDVQQTIERELSTYVSATTVFEAVKILGIPYQPRVEDSSRVAYLALSQKAIGFYQRLLEERRRRLSGNNI